MTLPPRAHRSSGGTGPPYLLAIGDPNVRRTLDEGSRSRGLESAEPLIPARGLGAPRPGAPTYPGTTDELQQPTLGEGSGLQVEIDFELGYSLDRIDPRHPTWTLETTPKVVPFISPRSVEATTDLYCRVVHKVPPVLSTRAAELAKLLENTFWHVTAKT